MAYALRYVKGMGVLDISNDANDVESDVKNS
jgi:hypothetical protein